MNFSGRDRFYLMPPLALHFVAGLESIFDKARRILREGGSFAFTMKVASSPASSQQKYDRQNSGEFEIFSHTPVYIEVVLARLLLHA
jgi:hypothetical protein